MLLPMLGRLFARPTQAELGDVGHEVGEAHVSPGHVQVMISLSREAKSVGALALELGISASAVSQLVDRLEEYGMVERRHDEGDRRLVLVDFRPEMRRVAREIVESRRRPLRRAFEQMSNEECQAFLRGMKLLAESLGEGEVDG
jgi:DNA-binding MarR family transcriptional regulator